MAFFCWHKWKPHYIRVKNVREYHERAALVGDMIQSALWGMPPFLSALVPHCHYPSGPGLVQSGDRCAKCGKWRR